MKKLTFTVFTDDDKVFGYLFDVTRAEAQKIVESINEETGEHHYYMDGFWEN